jgi:hypothetical protein
LKTTLLFWLVNFLPVAIALAIFEIWLEKYKTGPWGKTAFINPYWEEKLGWNVPFLKYLSRYHAIMFLRIMPLLFIMSMAFWGMILDYPIFPIEPSWFKVAASFLLLFSATWLGNSGAEDFLYFTIQSITGWREPHALRKVVVEKDFAWFKDWLPPVFGLNIPGHWVFCPVGAIVLLYIRQRWIMQ